MLCPLLYPRSHLTNLTEDPVGGLEEMISLFINLIDVTIYWDELKDAISAKPNRFNDVGSSELLVPRVGIFGW